MGKINLNYLKNIRGFLFKEVTDSDNTTIKDINGFGTTLGVSSNTFYRELELYRYKPTSWFNQEFFLTPLVGLTEVNISNLYSDLITKLHKLGFFKLISSEDIEKINSEEIKLKFGENLSYLYLIEKPYWHDVKYVLDTYMFNLVMDLNYKTKANVVRYEGSQLFIKDFEGIDEVISESFQCFDYVLDKPIKAVFLNIREYGLKYEDRLKVYGENGNPKKILDILDNPDSRSRKEIKVGGLFEDGLITQNGYLEEVNYIESVATFFNQSTLAYFQCLSKLEEEYFVRAYAKMAFDQGNVDSKIFSTKLREAIFTISFDDDDVLIKGIPQHVHPIIKDKRLLALYFFENLFKIGELIKECDILSK